MRLGISARMCGYQEEVSEAEDSSERRGLIGNRVFALRRRRQRIEHEFVSGKINCHQIVLKNVRADQTVSVAHRVLFRDVDNAIVELKIANHNLIYPCGIAADRSRISHAFQRVLREPPDANFLRELLLDGQAGSAGIEQEL